MNIFLTNPVIIILSVLALIITVSARFVKHRYVSEGLSVTSFLLVIANIIYALLLGAELEDVLVYILLFALIGAIAFIPSSYKNDAKNTEENMHGKEKSVDANSDSEIVESNYEEEER